MRKFVGCLLFLPFLIACGSDPASTDTNVLHLDSGKVQTDVITMDPDSELVIADASFAQVLKDFPKEWVKVDVKKDKKIYTELCGMDSPSLKIELVKDHWEIRTIYGQDAESWYMINMTANLNVFNEQELQEGIFVVEKITYPDNEIYEVKYFWNRTAGFCTFGDFFSPDTRFAESSKMNEFEVVKEDCD